MHTYVYPALNLRLALDQAETLYMYIAVGLLRKYFEICFYETMTRIQCTLYKQ
jgi:hypothetical protein